MRNVQEVRTGRSKKLVVLWLSFTLLDSDLHKNALLQILQQFSRLGHKPTLLAVRSKNHYQNNNGFKERIIAVPLRYVPILSTIFFTIVETIFLPFYIIFSKPDFIIYDPDIHILSSFPSLLISKLTKTKLILDIRTVPVETAGIRGALRKYWFSISLLVAKHFFDGETIITQSMKKQVSTEYNLNPERMGVWTSGVSVSLFNPELSLSEGSNLKEALGLSKKFVVFYHGVFTHTRALKETIEAISLLVAEYPDITLFLLGSGPSLPLLRVIIKKYNLVDHVIIHDPVEQFDVPKFISFCNVGIIPLPDHPYWRFQSPLKLMEYLSMAKVAILTDITAHRSVIGDAKCGIYVSSVDPSELARAIEYAYLHREYLQDWGKMGRTIILKDYTWLKVSEDLEHFLFKLKT